MPAGPDAQHMLDPSSMSVVIVIAARLPAERSSFLFPLVSNAWRARGVGAFHQFLWTAGRPILCGCLLCFVAQLLFWCSGRSGDEILRFQERIQWRVNGCVLVFNLSLTPCGFFVRAVLLYSIVLCSILFCRCSLEPYVCVTSTHFCCTLVLRHSVSSTVSALSQDAGRASFSKLAFASDGWRIKLSHSCGDHSSCCRVGTWPVVCQLVWVLYCCSAQHSPRRIVDPSTSTDNQHDTSCSCV